MFMQPVIKLKKAQNVLYAPILLGLTANLLRLSWRQMFEALGQRALIHA
jgi:hypothetical protein